MRRYFITGGTGFVGRALVRELLSRDSTEQIVCLTRGLRPNALTHPKLSYWQGDITRVQFPTLPFTDIIHAAAEANDLLAPDKLQYYYDVVEGAKRVFDWMRKSSGINNLFVSSGAVLKGDSVYCRAKRLSELLAPGDCAIARVYSLVGPEMPFNGQYALGRFIHQAVYDNCVRFYESGSVRSYLHVDDCARWLLRLLDEGQTCAFTTYDVGSSLPITIRQLAYQVANIAGVHCEEVPREDYHPTAQVYVPDVDAAYALGCVEAVSLNTAIEQALKACILNAGSAQ